MLNFSQVPNILRGIPTPLPQQFLYDYAEMEGRGQNSDWGKKEVK
jgi:hypothetical protein